MAQSRPKTFADLPIEVRQQYALETVTKCTIRRDPYMYGLNCWIHVIVNGKKRVDEWIHTTSDGLTDWSSDGVWKRPR